MFMAGLIRSLVDDTRHARWVGDMIAGARKRAQRAADASSRLVYVGLQHGVVDAADFLSPRLKRTRLFQPMPDVSPSSQQQVRSYLAGYLSGHLLTGVFHARAEAGLSVEGADATRIGQVCSVYSAVLAAPKIQERLALGNGSAVLAAHDAAMTAVAERRMAVEEGLELAMLSWLMARSNAVFNDAYRAAALRLRSARPAKVVVRQERSSDASSGEA
jgi:hypothetical protein